MAPKVQILKVNKNESTKNASSVKEFNLSDENFFKGPARAASQAEPAQLSP